MEFHFWFYILLAACQHNIDCIIGRTDHQGFPRMVDGNADGTAAADMDAREFNRAPTTSPVI